MMEALWKDLEELFEDDASNDLNIVLQRRPGGSYEAYLKVGLTNYGFGYGTTPIEALENLKSHILEVIAERESHGQ